MLLPKWHHGVMSEDIDGALQGVGERLRELRRSAGRTLAELSEATGISVSTLSRLEAGKRKPTLELLLPLSQAYAVPLDELVGAPPAGDPRIHIRPLRVHGQTILPLSRGSVGVNAFKHVLPAGRQKSRPALGTHPGHEWLYVLRGRLRLVLGAKAYVLGAGEAAEFETRTPHWFGNESDDESVEVLSIFGVEGQRVHVNDLT